MPLWLTCADDLAYQGSTTDTRSTTVFAPVLQAVVTVPRGGQAEPYARVLYTDRKPKGIVHFVGGAVVGAAPGLSYKHLVQRMAQGGYTVVQTSYPFTFSHQALALDLRRVRHTCHGRAHIKDQSSLDRHSAA